MNPDTLEFLAGYNEWYNNLSPAGGAAEMEKLKGGKMKIKEIKERLKQYYIENKKLTETIVGFQLIKDLKETVAEIEFLEKENQEFKEVRKEQLDITAQGEIECLQIELEQHQAVCEAAEKACKQWFDWTGRYDNKMDMIKFIDLMLKLKKALAAKGKNEKVS